ncbi:DNA-binding CsgD family transcriptional regulator [Kitasatospora sp. GAS204A]|uniref:helix-turn-helix transcriptional regulator n=1 Tax=unclassified Kitasatospora TaxID=2633591 RepID=UPI002473348A|nr:LuxR family transcriptional regulator [Kitasatospora sp. GAS204B]MDH6118560.1 DNA-binding CsgD family transcriptional regulator [Kitasatospora sp. GAS204B]
MRTTSPITVGRAGELAMLDSALTDVRARQGRAVFLLGEPGIGKSRLAGECAQQAGALGMPVLRGRAGAGGTGTPFRPLREALASRFRLGRPPADPELEPYRPALARLVPEWRTAEGPDGHGCVVELAEALLRLLALVGRAGGCVLVLEDLHDADPETTAVLEYLVDNVAEVPVLLLATLRPEPGPGRDLVRAAERRRGATVAELLPLVADEVRALAAGCLETAAVAVPDAVVDRLVADGDGNPYLAEELLGDLVGSGALRHGERGWQVVGELGPSVPATIVQSYDHRLGLLGAQVRELLLIGACLGPRFCVDTVQLITGHDDRSMFAGLRSAGEADFIVPDPAAPGWYAFRHALTAEALLATVPPLERAALARHAATELERADPELRDDHCQLAADLRLAADDPGGAAVHYAEAGRRALAAGASGSAVALLERAQQLAAVPDRTAVTESLIDALAEAGQLGQALTLVTALPPAGAASLGVGRRLALHTRLAWCAVTAERPQEAAAQVAAARALLDDGAAPEQRAPLAAVESHLALLPGPGDPQARQADAERLARQAAQVAQRVPLPVVACQAWQLLALLAREQGFDHADSYLIRMLEVAETHGLGSWRVEALLRLGMNECMRTGEPHRLDQARQASLQLGSVRVTQSAEGALAMNAVLRGEPQAAREIIDRCLGATARLGNLATHRYLLLTAATLAAHQGRRREMERELLAFSQIGGEDFFLMPVLLGLCRAICALLEEDRPLATAELAAARDWERRNPNVYYLAGQHGLHPLLEVLAGEAGWDRYQEVEAGPAAPLTWNGQFLLLARAVLLGRDGRGEEAEQAVAAAQRCAALFPMARHLGLRLVAEAAVRDGWGDPVAWLRTAEEYFHALDVPAVARACRTLLRQAGVSVAQHRGGRDRIPPALRAVGVTLREYEVFTLLVEGPGNQQIARELSISPRTVEKHMANLISKTGCQDRAALCELAVESCAAEGEPQV